MVLREADLRKWNEQAVERRFSALLALLLALLAGPPILIGFGLSAMWFDGLMSVVMVAAIASLCFERRQRLFALWLGIPSIVMTLGGHVLPERGRDAMGLIGHAFEVLFLFGSAGLIAKSLFGSEVPTVDTLIGAVCGYLFVGLGWAVLYSMLEAAKPGSFQLGGNPLLRDSHGRPPGDILTYYSFVTLTTVGYGDVVPATPATRTLAWMEAIFGQFYLAVIVAGIVSMFASRRGNKSI